MTEAYGMSTIELYRGGVLHGDAFPYDLADPLDTAIFGTVQAYASFLETARAENPRLPVPDCRTPAALECRLLRLAGWHRGRERISPAALWDLAYAVLRILYEPLTQPEAGEHPPSLTSHPFSVCKRFFEAGSGLPDSVPARSPDRPKTATRDPLWMFYEGMGPTSSLIRSALGPLISQSEAARTLGLTPRGVALRIQRGEMRSVAVGRGVLVPLPDVQDASQLHDRRRSRPPADS